MSRVFHASKMENEDDELCIGSAVFVAVVARKKKRRSRSCWVKYPLANLIDHNLGHMLP